MTGLSEVDGSALEGVSATTLWTLHNRASDAMRNPPSSTLLEFG